MKTNPGLWFSVGIAALAHALLLSQPLNTAASSQVGKAGVLSVRLYAIAQTRQQAAMSEKLESQVESTSVTTVGQSQALPTGTVAKVATVRRKASLKQGRPGTKKPLPTTRRTQKQQTQANSRKTQTEPIRQETAQANNPGQDKVAADSNKAPTTATTDHSNLVARLYQALLRQRHYPDKARRRGWEGTALLGFVLLPDGHFDRVKLLQGSGRRVLDQAALQALTAVQPFYAPEVKQPLPLQIALSYQLD